MMYLIAEHWVTAAILAVIAAYFAANLAQQIIRRAFSTVKVICRGWPPAHLDADGDWRPIDDQESEETEA